MKIESTKVMLQNCFYLMFPHESPGLSLVFLELAQTSVSIWKYPYRSERPEYGGRPKRANQHYGVTPTILIQDLEEKKDPHLARLMIKNNRQKLDF